ncbi:uncharacterized protein TRAVEDRAFT_108590, partial [Trametes versicolor FP-101664 SS1]|uniref:uncharacterized protein n=1 Tax=Trametes versicolor (strain FP-101664) TaxID=717944 RepID=UPI00046218D0
PPDDELREELLQYAKEHLPLERRIKHLENKFGYYIRLTKLKELNKKFHVPSSRKPPPLPLATAIICNWMDKDIARRNGDALNRPVRTEEGDGREP